MRIKQKYPNLPEDFRDLCKKTRVARGIPMRQMARDLGGFPAMVSQHESGQRNFSYERAVQFRDYLGFDYDLPIPAPDEAQKITRNRNKNGSIVKDEPFFIHVNGELIEILTFRRLGPISEATQTSSNKGKL